MDNARVRGGAGARADDAVVASIRVLRGAAVQEFLFRRGAPSRLRVGSDEAASWRFERADVAPRQLDIVWDAHQLWLQDALRLGRTFVNGRTLNEWMCIHGPALVGFGRVRLCIVSYAPKSDRRAPDFNVLDRARLTDAQHHARHRLRETGRFTLPPGFVLPQLSEQDAP